MRLASWLTLLLASSCSTPPLKRIDTCLTDPERDTLHCDQGPIPWPAARGYVCHPLDQWADYIRDCHP